MPVFNVGLLPRSLFYSALPQGLNPYMCTNTRAHTQPQRLAQFIAGFKKQYLKTKKI